MARCVEQPAISEAARIILAVQVRRIPPSVVDPGHHPLSAARSSGRLAVVATLRQGRSRLDTPRDLPDRLTPGGSGVNIGFTYLSRRSEDTSPRISPRPFWPFLAQRMVMPHPRVRYIGSRELHRDLPKVLESLEDPSARFVLTIHSKPKAVLIGAEAFLSLLRGQTPEDRLLALATRGPGPGPGSLHFFRRDSRSRGELRDSSPRASEAGLTEPASPISDARLPNPSRSTRRPIRGHIGSISRRFRVGATGGPNGHGLRLESRRISSDHLVG